MTVLRSEALRSLKPWAEYVWTGGDWSGLKWLDTVQKKPTEEEVDAEVIRLKALWDADDYKRKRAREYPSLVDQLDDIYHNGIDAWKATIKATKDKYPKS